ncbi:MAG: phenylalanine--tRNA ligase subunit alpha [Verrucomicrobiota bacterium]|nr:phenylalanine--tRNA ligase subunit alpha [Verrucomicrobiota bacterium]
MEASIKSLLADAQAGAAALQSLAEFEAYKARFVGPNGSFTEIRKKMGTLPPAEKPAFGKLVNEGKNALDAIFAEVRARLETAALAASLGQPVDATLPSPDSTRGTYHLLTQVREEICGILKRAGFVIAEGPEIDTEWFCFDALNTPFDHPARDLQDTYYLQNEVVAGNVQKRANERYLLRTHTSTVQVRTMLAKQPPLRIVSPGRCFRRDTADATHGANFHQIECLYVDKGVTVRDLKAILDYLFRSLLGPDAVTRFRPHFFPYTEPSFEVDFKSKHLSKVGKEWMEIMGCGMVDPAVFESVGYDPKVWSGYAFGLGVERIAMTLYGVDDIRYLFANDQRFLGQFA